MELLLDVDQRSDMIHILNNHAVLYIENRLYCVRRFKNRGTIAGLQDKRTVALTRVIAVGMQRSQILPVWEIKPAAPPRRQEAVC